MCKTVQRYLRQILAMNDGELELFVDDWMGRKVAGYVATEVWAGAGDLGRDVVGYLTTRRMEGPWHLFQCKQLSSSLSLPDAIRELGKVFHHTAEGRYGLPDAYVFVAPRNVSRPLKEMVAAPSRFRQAMLDGWDSHCASRIVEKTVVPLSTAIKALIEGFDFSKVSTCDALAMVKDHDAKATMVKFFGDDPGDWQADPVPTEVQDVEGRYLWQLIDAYGERVGTPFADTRSVIEHGEYKDHLRDQRVRFFHAASFKRSYRDNTPREMMVAFEDEIYHGVVDTWREPSDDSLQRLDKVMKQAVAVAPGGVLGRYGRVPVRQGFCHHFANEDRLKWKR